MNNEPVAYRHLHEDGWEYYDAPTGEDCNDCIPLYTHPAKHLSLQKVDGELVAVTYTDDEHRIIEVLWEKPPAKTLTDEEILNLKDEYTKVPSKPWSGIPMAHFDVCGFARAILRKAQNG